MYQPGNQMPPYRRPSMKGPLLVMLFVFALIGGAFFFVFRQVRTVIDQALPAGLEATIVAGSGEIASIPPLDAPVRLVGDQGIWVADIDGDELPEILGQGYVANAYGILLLDGASGKLLWNVPLSDTSIKLGYFSDVVITARERELRAYAIDDGRALWTATLPDKVQIYPFRAYAIDDALVVQSADNALTSFNRQTGAQNWQVTLREPYAQDFQRLADTICDSERPEDNPEAIYCYDLRTGEPARTYELGIEQFDRALWWADDQPQNPGLYRLRPSGDALTLERLGVDGAAQWAQPLPEEFERSSASDFTLVSQGDQLAIGTEDRVAVISAGGPPVIVQQTERALYPIGFDGPNLYLAAVKQRGTPTLLVQTIAAGTGEILHMSPEIANSDSSLDMAEPRWAVLPGQGLLVGAQDIEDDDKVLVQLVGGDSTIAWRYTQTMFIGRQPAIRLSGNRLLFSTSDLVAVLDARTGQVLWQIEN
ncbi:MAG: PQQ-binding-like beta-propeller repeat protein [Herpetosiphonaceae bacterium]|nr:PQQ-binding-like beta-propeller repeat protein [Herpetosiphonaceae bacterium]